MMLIYREEVQLYRFIKVTDYLTTYMDTWWTIRKKSFSVAIDQNLSLDFE